MNERHLQKISVIVPENPFVQPELRDVKQCLTALNVQDLMRWWPGEPHSPHRNPEKVKAIQRSLDWRRVAEIAAYLLQDEIQDAPRKLDQYFSDVYEPKMHEPGREWPPRIPRVIGFKRSSFPTFSNVLLHVNGARVEDIKNSGDKTKTGNLLFDDDDAKLLFTVIDGQHRINGAFFAIRIRQETDADANWEIPSEIFLDLDKRNEPPRMQAQIFIDVNTYQKKVDRSLVADLFPTARGERGPLDDKERAQDLGRKLMLESGPLVGMVQIPGIKFGVKEVVTLATLNNAVEDALPHLNTVGLESLEEQTEFIAQCLEAWLDATGRRDDHAKDEKELASENVVYQGRVLVSVLALIPACLLLLRGKRITPISQKAQTVLHDWFVGLANRAGMMVRGRFMPKSEFKKRGFHGSGGIARLRDSLWAASGSTRTIAGVKPERLSELALKARNDALRRLQQS